MTNLSVTKTMSRLGTVVFLFIFNIGISIFVFLLTGMMIFLTGAVYHLRYVFACQLYFVYDSDL